MPRDPKDVLADLLDEIKRAIVEPHPTDYSEFVSNFDRLKAELFAVPADPATPVQQ